MTAVVDSELLPSATDISADCNAVKDAMALQRWRTAAVLTHYYGVDGLAGYASGLDASSARARYMMLTSLTHQNAMGAVIDTRLSQTVRVPDLRVQTLGGNYARQRSARKIGQWLSGSFRKAGFSPIVWQVATDAATCPLGAARAWYQDDGLHLMRVRYDQVIYNPSEGKTPCNLWLKYGVHRKKLVARAEKDGNKDLVSYLKSESAPRYTGEQIFRSLDLLGTVEADMLEVIEHWRLPEDDEPGVYSSVCGEKLLNEGKNRAWNHPFFPVVELTDFPSFDHFGGRSLGDQLLPYQLRLNKMTTTIDTGIERLCKGRVFMPIGAVPGTQKTGSPTERSQFSRTVGEFVEFNHAFGPPVIQAGQAFGPEYYQRQDKVELAMWELAGVDRSSGTGTEPAGMADASGKARREKSEAVSARHKRFTDQLDNWTERLCTVALAMAIDHFAGTSDTGVTKKRRRIKVIAAAGTELLEEVKWKELDIKETDGVLVRCVGVSGLPAHPSARLEYAKEGYEAGFWNKTYSIKLLGQPDIERAEDSATAAFDLATHHIEGALHDGKRFQPEPNREYLEVLVDIGARELMRALRLGVEETHAEMLRIALETAKKMLEGMTPAAPVPAVHGATPPGAGMAAQGATPDASLGAMQ